MRLALIYEHEDGRLDRFTFRDLRRLSNRLANALAALGLRRGDRVGILLPQAPETAIAHLAVYKAGLVAVPLFTLFGEDALEYRLADSRRPRGDHRRANLPKVRRSATACPSCERSSSSTAAAHGTHDFRRRCSSSAGRLHAGRHRRRRSGADHLHLRHDREAKGALHAHRVLLGHLPGVELPHEFFPQPGDLFWTPADWAWIGGLLDVLLPALASRRAGARAPLPQVRSRARPSR